MGDLFMIFMFPYSMASLLNCSGCVNDAGWHLLREWRQQNVSICEMALRLNVSRSSVGRHLARDTPPSARVTLRLLPHERARRARAAGHRRRLVVALAEKRCVKLSPPPTNPDRQNARKRTIHNKLVYPSLVALSRAMFTHHHVSVSPSAVGRDLKASGYTAKVRPRGPRRYELDESIRLKFCREHVRNDELGRKIVFSDEKFSDCNDHGSKWQWCRGRIPAMHAEKARWAPKIHVWGCVGIGVKHLIVLPVGAKVTSATYIKWVLRPVKALLRGRVFQQDGARAHSAVESYEWLKRNSIRTLEAWPPRSPDLSPIETIWAMVQRRVDRMGPTSVEDLTTFWLRCWQEIPQAEVGALVRGWQGRLRRCVRLACLAK